MRRIIVFGLGQQPANRLAAVGDGLGAVIGLAGAARDDESRIIRLLKAATVRHFHGHFETIGQLTVESLRITGQQGIFNADCAIIIVEHAGAEAHRLSQHTESVTEWTIGHEARMQRLCH